MENVRLAYLSCQLGMNLRRGRRSTVNLAGCGSPQLFHLRKLLLARIGFRAWKVC